MSPDNAGQEAGRFWWKWVGLSSLGVAALWAAAVWTFFAWDGTQKGQPGDAFAAVNALFAGLAFAFVIVAIRLQSKELALQRQELKDTRTELKKTADANVEAVKASKEQSESLLYASYLDALESLRRGYADNMGMAPLQELLVLEEKHKRVCEHLEAIVAHLAKKLPGQEASGWTGLQVDAVSQWIGRCVALAEEVVQRLNAASFPGTTSPPDLLGPGGFLASSAEQLDRLMVVLDQSGDRALPRRMADCSEKLRRLAAYTPATFGVSEFVSAATESANVLGGLAHWLRNGQPKVRLQPVSHFSSSDRGEASPG